MNDHIISVSFMSDFQKGVSVESFYLIKNKNQTYLYRYEVTDPSKFIF